MEAVVSGRPPPQRGPPVAYQLEHSAPRLDFAKDPISKATTSGTAEAGMSEARKPASRGNPTPGASLDQSLLVDMRDLSMRDQRPPQSLNFGACGGLDRGGLDLDLGGCRDLGISPVKKILS